jgi:hypothetical protein
MYEGADFSGLVFCAQHAPARPPKPKHQPVVHILGTTKKLSRVTLFGEGTRALTFQKSQPQPVLDFTSWLGGFGSVAKAPGNNFVPCKEYFTAACSSLALWPRRQADKSKTSDTKKKRQETI